MLFPPTVVVRLVVDSPIRAVALPSTGHLLSFRTCGVMNTLVLAPGLLVTVLRRASGALVMLGCRQVLSGIGPVAGGILLEVILRIPPTELVTMPSLFRRWATLLLASVTWVRLFKRMTLLCENAGTVTITRVARDM